MTLDEAIAKLLELPQFKEDQKKDAKLRVYAGRLKTHGAKSSSARDLLLKYGFLENYSIPKNKKG